MDPQRHLMYAELSCAPVDIATDLAIPIIARAGLGAVTPSAIAAVAGYSRQAVHQWFGGQGPLREAVADRFVARWRRWIDVRVHRDGPAAMLPDSDQVAEWCRVWLALVEHSARTAHAARLVDVVRAEERQVLARALGVGCGAASDGPVVPTEIDGSERVEQVERVEETVDALHCLLEGLRLRLCRSGALAGFETARLLVAGLCGRPDRIRPPGRHVA